VAIRDGRGLGGERSRPGRLGQPPGRRLLVTVDEVLALLALAHCAVAQSGRQLTQTDRGGDVAAEAAAGGGQALELACEKSQTGIGQNQLREISVRKTGALFRAAARLGGIAAGASAEQLAALTEYGEAFGDAFQITDDLLDMGQDQQRATLPTYVTVLGTDGARVQAAARAGQAKTALADFGERAAHLIGIMDIMMSRRD
jgi:hypothetical protein